MSPATSKNTLDTYDTLIIGDKTYGYFKIQKAEATLGPLGHLPCCMRVLLENTLRHENDTTATLEDMRAIVAFETIQRNTPVITFAPQRLLLDDPTGLSAMADFAALRDLMTERKGESTGANSLCPTTIVVENAPPPPTDPNRERFAFLKWAQNTFTNLTVVPPHKGWVNQINLDALAQVVVSTQDDEVDETILVPDSVLGTNPQMALSGSCGVLGWGIDTLEAEAIMLGERLSLYLPQVIGIKITGKLHKGTQITDMALALSHALQQAGCAGKFVEFFGNGLDHLTVKDRAVLARFAMEAGSAATMFPIDAQVIEHLTMTGATPLQIAITETYAKAQGLWREQGSHDTFSYSTMIEFPVEGLRPLVRPTLAIQPIALGDAKAFFEKRFPRPPEKNDPLAILRHGDVIWADIGSHDGVIHAQELLAAAMVARKALARGLKIKPWVRAFIKGTSSVGESLLAQTGLLDDIKALGFQFFGAGGQVTPSPIPPPVEEAIRSKNIAVCSLVTSAPLTEVYPASLCKISYIMPPSLIVIYAIAGTVLIDPMSQAIATDKEGHPVMLKELLPTTGEINAMAEKVPLAPIYQTLRENLLKGNEEWDAIKTHASAQYPWRLKSTWIKKPPFLDSAPQLPRPLKNCTSGKILAIYGDNVPATTMAPEGLIPPQSSAGRYLTEQGDNPDSLGPYLWRTGNHDAMTRGAFAGKGLINALLPVPNRSETGLTLHNADPSPIPFFDAASLYNDKNTPTFVAGGKNFGCGRLQEWAVKSLRLQNVYAVLAESFDPSFRKNLLRVGVLPLQLKSGITVTDLNLSGEEFIHLAGLPDIEQIPGQVMMTIDRSDGVERYMLLCRIDTAEEMAMYRYGSMWAMALISLADKAKT
ncbi:MAG: aconitase family protein [Alphaproteobacteria bacterium]|nr:aconitase family protein [Alphaproteobacteria bacterium]